MLPYPRQPLLLPAASTTIPTRVYRYPTSVYHFSYPRRPLLPTLVDRFPYPRRPLPLTRDCTTPADSDVCNS